MIILTITGWLRLGLKNSNSLLHNFMGTFICIGIRFASTTVIMPAEKLPFFRIAEIFQQFNCFLYSTHNSTSFHKTAGKRNRTASRFPETINHIPAMATPAPSKPFVAHVSALAVVTIMGIKDYGFYDCEVHLNNPSCPALASLTLARAISQ